MSDLIASKHATLHAGSGTDSATASPVPVFEYQIVVQLSDIDEMNHANNVCYVRWMQEAAVAHSTHNGWSTPRYFEAGHAWVARRHTVEYLQPALIDDEIIVRTWVADFKRVTSRRKYQFLRKSDQTILAVAETFWAFLSLETRRPVKIPQAVSDRFLAIGEEPTTR